MQYTLAMRALKISAISVIGLVAVVLGMSALAPALANQMEPDGFGGTTGPPPLSEECQECDEELDEEMLEIDEEESECKEDAGTDAEEVAECVAEAEDDRLEAAEEHDECFEDNACMP